MTNRSARRVAALYDVHGNLPALDAALAAAASAGADVYVLGGDLALGPMPTEVLHRLDEQLGSRAHYLRGNCDRLMVDAETPERSRKRLGPLWSKRPLRNGGEWSGPESKVAVGFRLEPLLDPEHPLQPLGQHYM